MKCPYCGKENKDPVDYCNYCGKLINKTGKSKISETKTNNSILNKKDKRILILVGIIVLVGIIAVVGTYLTNPPANVANYPNINQSVISNFNKYDKNHDNYVSEKEYRNSVRDSVYQLIYPKYFKHTNGFFESSMTLNDYNSAYDTELKQINVERAKDRSIAKQNNDDAQQLYDNWYASNGNPSLSEEQNQQLFMDDVRAQALGYEGYY